MAIRSPGRHSPTRVNQVNQPRRYSAPALEKGFDIVEYLSSTSTPKSQSEIAKALERSPNEIYRLLVVLESRGYLVRDEDSGKYYLSLKLFTISHAHSPVEKLRQGARLPMLELADSIGQSCHLSVPYGDHLLVVNQTRGPTPVSLSISRGTLFPLVSTVSGQVLLAHLKRDQVERILEREPGFASRSRGQKMVFYSTLDTIRKQGYHRDSSELTAGVTDMAVFVGQPETEIVAALAVSSLTTVLGTAYEEVDIIRALIKAANSINRRIGLGKE